MSDQNWLDHLQFVLSESFTSEFVDSVDKTRVLVDPPHTQSGMTPEYWEQHKKPTIVTDASPNEFSNPLTEPWLTLELVLRELSDDMDEVSFGDFVLAEYDEIASTD